MRTKLLPATLLASLAIGMMPKACAQMLVYNFNGTNSSTASNAGSLSGATLTYHNASNTVGNMYSGAGTGVSGNANDNALDNTSASGMGTIGNSMAGASTTSRSVSIGTLGSFTIAGWYNASTTPGSNAKLFELSQDSSHFVTLYTESSTRIALSINGTSTNSFSTAGYSGTGSWIFFAASYNGTSSTNNLRFYIGDANPTSSLVLSGTRSLASGEVALTGAIGVGVGNGYYNNGAANRPFDGLMDDVSFYGAGTGSAAGALSMSQINDLRLAAIPEPGTAMLLMGGLAFTILRLRRRQSSRAGTLRGRAGIASDSRCG